MWSRGHQPISKSEHQWLAMVKSIKCAVCDEDCGPLGLEAHHIKQGDHYTAIGLCHDCHAGPIGWHGTKVLWRIKKMDEIDALNVTIKRVFEGTWRG